MSLFLGFVCLTIATIAIAVLLQTVMRPVRRIPKRREQIERMTSGEDSSKYKQLLRMLNGDRGAADSLAHAYGVDKAIDALIRDRR